MDPVIKPLVIIPTYNERENVAEIIATIEKENPSQNIEVLVVDSASPDGTAEVVRDIQKNKKFVHLFEQTAKLGLGRAYLDGMTWALKESFDCIITMDADFSHHPRYLKDLLREMQNHDLVIGSRYAPGGKLLNWPAHRQWLSRFANWYARTLTGLPFSDLTAGFHCFRRDLLKKVLRYKIHTDGYAFLVELKFLAIMQKARFREVPIVFSDRTKGDSKISKRVIFESMLFVLSRALQRKRVRASVAEIRVPDGHRSQTQVSH